MKKNSVRTIFFIFILFNISPNTKCQDVKKDIYEEIVLEIPPVRITRYEYEKNVNEFINTYKNTNNVGPSEEILSNWRKEYIDKNYLLAELYNQGYDKRQDVLNTVNSMERIILTQDHGLVYDEFVTKKVNISEDAVKAAYERSGKHIKVEYLKFPNNESIAPLVSIFKKNGRIETKDDFKTLTAICKENPQIKYDTAEFVWPYFGMETIAEKMYNLKKDEIIPPTEMKNGVYTYCATDVFYLEKTPYEKIRPRVRRILEENKKTSLRTAFYSKVDTAIFSRVDEVVCYKFMKKYDIELFKDIDEPKRTKNLHMQFKDILKDTMLVYSFDTVKLYLTVESFLNYYSHGAMLRVFASQSDLSKYLATYVQEEYILQLADSLGIKKNIKHQLDKSNYKNKTALGFFEARELMPQTQLSDEEIEKHYKNNQSEFHSGETAEISVYTFDTERNAYFGKTRLSNSANNKSVKNTDTTKMNGLNGVNTISVTRNNSPYPLTVLSIVFGLKDNQFSNPVKFSNVYIIIQKHKETGSIVKPIEEVREGIIQNIKKIKLDTLKNEQILLAKKKYQVRVNKIVLP